MARGRDRGRLGAVSATLSAGTLVFFAAGTTPASAQTRSAAASDCLPLLKLVCDILGVGGSDPSTPPPKSSTPKPSGAPKPKPKPKPAGKAPTPARHASGGGGAAPPAGYAPTIPVPQSAQAPALPNVGNEDPLVLPESALGAESPSARLVADDSPGGETISPLLVATASGLIGAIAALHISVLSGRRRN